MSSIVPTPIGSEPAAPATAGWDSGSLSSPLGKSATAMLVFLVLLWLIDLVNAQLDRRWTFDYGIVGRDTDHLAGIVVSQFLHADAHHLVANASALFTLGLLVGLYGIWRLIGVVTVIVVLGGVVDWLVAPSNTVSVGASGIVFGLFGYLLARGLVERRPVDIVVSLGVAVAFGYYYLTGMLPTDERIAWWGHLAGFLAGAVAAWVFQQRSKAAAQAEQVTDGQLPGLPGTDHTP